MEPVFLSDIELYFSEKISDDIIKIDGEEYNHIVHVMRHRINDLLHVTDGMGAIFISQIKEISNQIVAAKIIDKILYPNKFENITFCIPILKSADRLEFALEKCIEVGITNFIFFASDFSVKKLLKLSRIEKIAFAAMKQSLRAWKPKISFTEKLKNLITPDADLIVFDQNAEIHFDSEFISQKIHHDNKYYFIFGPEGGFSPKEYEIMIPFRKVHLTQNRLRSETAIIAAGLMIGID